MGGSINFAFNNADAYQSPLDRNEIDALFALLNCREVEVWGRKYKVNAVEDISLGHHLSLVVVAENSENDPFGNFALNYDMEEGFIRFLNGDLSRIRTFLKACF